MIRVAVRCRAIYFVSPCKIAGDVKRVTVEQGCDSM